MPQVRKPLDNAPRFFQFEIGEIFRSPDNARQMMISVPCNWDLAFSNNGTDWTNWSSVSKDPSQVYQEANIAVPVSNFPVYTLFKVIAAGDVPEGAVVKITI